MQATTTRPYVNRHFDRYQLSDAQLYRIFRYKGKRIPQLKPARKLIGKRETNVGDNAIASIRSAGKPGSIARIAALSAYYAGDNRELSAFLEK